MARTLMVQGCTSDAGKSTVVTGLCRLLWRKHVRVVPFKPQNMALNSAVTIDGGEIGRAQAVQAQACSLRPHSDMNPVLLKPNSDTGAQIIIHGKALMEMDATAYHRYKTVAMNAVLESHQRLSQQYDAIIVEGAGSPAEINLRDRDIANMGFAEAVDCPVILVADIDRGGVFAHIVGTLELLSDSERRRVKGFIINRFRGDISLLQNGLDWLEQKTGKPVLGVMNYLHGLHLEAEDAINSHQPTGDSTGKKLKIIVPVLSRISNHTDFDVLRLHPQVDLQFVHINTPSSGTPFPEADVIIIPGSKSVRADLALLKTNGWPDVINKHLRYGGKLIGICGGLQMLGNKIHDPHGIEGQAGSSDALGLLDFETTLEKEKQLHRVSGSIIGGKIIPYDSAVSGYEIHAGISSGPALENYFIALDDKKPGDKKDGAISGDKQIIVTYLHGLFDEQSARNAILEWAGLKDVKALDYHALQDKEIDRLADEMDRALDMQQILQIMDDGLSTGTLASR